ncbi:hypothetical protein [Psychrobacter jeotgali]|uniref:hypothetical protein n=1 Tax=Psychrobacter jeotgali TaxID=179010 RepID=UPI001917EE19|nr:hypothetical protein [Psychrobacter jeotgali]
MKYTAIIKDGGLFIPNVFSDINDGSSHIVQVEMDIENVRQQLNENEAPKKADAKSPKKQVARQAKKAVHKSAKEVELDTPRNSAVDELEALDDIELSEILKAYINDGLNDKEESLQISLEDL